MALTDERHEVNGFIFNGLGELLEKPERPTREMLHDTLDKLYEQREYIKASRIQQLLTVQF
ncbi:hypothetical protein EHW61_16650 [Salinivibrio sp. VYel6]|uniref:hypothetical protein n=1 Tax=Salinivibrio sp. VYel6 TaxID=2490493 RepID=UPI00128B310D|nr:hypothetical protein [Salinivibrio sp. VYel6]MPX98256.1 hypothetical protein [Salinivibrio sp. VYel6]